MKKALKQKELFYYADGVHKIGASSDITGDCTGLVGDCTGLRGDCSGLHGDCTGIFGDIDDCVLSESERERGVSVADLVEGEQL